MHKVNSTIRGVEPKEADIYTRFVNVCVGVYVRVYIYVQVKTSRHFTASLKDPGKVALSAKERRSNHKNVSSQRESNSRSKEVVALLQFLERDCSHFTQL